MYEFAGLQIVMTNNTSLNIQRCIYTVSNTVIENNCTNYIQELVYIILCNGCEIMQPALLPHLQQMLKWLAAFLPKFQTSKISIFEVDAVFFYGQISTFLLLCVQPIHAATLYTWKSVWLCDCCFAADEILCSVTANLSGHHNTWYCLTCASSPLTSWSPGPASSPLPDHCQAPLSTLLVLWPFSSTTSCPAVMSKIEGALKWTAPKLTSL